MKRVRLWLRLARLAAVLLLGLALANAVAVAERLYRHDLMALRQRLTRWFLARLSGALPFDVEVRGELPQGRTCGSATMCRGPTSRCSASCCRCPSCPRPKCVPGRWPAGWRTRPAPCLSAAARVTALLARQLHRHLEAGRQLLIFPEGTTTDGQQVHAPSTAC